MVIVDLLWTLEPSLWLDDTTAQEPLRGGHPYRGGPPPILEAGGHSVTFWRALWGFLLGVRHRFGHARVEEREHEEPRQRVVLDVVRESDDHSTVGRESST